MLRTPGTSYHVSLRHTSSSQDKVRNAALSCGTAARHRTWARVWLLITVVSHPSGEALNVDLSDFNTQLYALVQSLSLAPDLDAAATPTPTTPTSELFFRALHLAFAPRTAVPPWRTAAFAKRLLTAALHWPGTVALRALEFVARLVAREPRLEALLSTEDRTVDGVYRPDVEDPQLSNPFTTSAYELHLLRTAHIDAQVREAAVNLVNYVRT